MHGPGLFAGAGASEAEHQSLALSMASALRELGRVAHKSLPSLGAQLQSGLWIQ